MRFFTNAVILAAAMSAVALPAPASEADIDLLRAQGMSEHDIAARFPHSGHTTASLLVRPRVDTDGEVAPGRFVARDVPAHAGLAEDSEEGRAVIKHVHAVLDFIRAVLGGHVATVGNGGVAMRRRGAVRFANDEAGVELAEAVQRPARWVYHFRGE